MPHLGDYLKDMVVILGPGTESSLSKLVLDPYAVLIHMGGGSEMLKVMVPTLKEL